MNVSILIATCGEPAWAELAMSRAYPSALGQGALEIIPHHHSAATVAEARNGAAERASGDWLCFLDADDELCPGYLEEMGFAVNYPLSHPGVVGWPDKYLLAPAVSYCDGRSSTQPAIPSKGRWPDLNECVIGTLVTRRMFQEVGGFRELPSLEDYDLWLRCARLGARIVHVPKAVYCAHQRPGSRNSDQSVYAQLREEHAEVWGMGR